MQSVKSLYVIKIRDAKREWFLRVNKKGEARSGWVKEGWVTTFQEGIMAGNHDITDRFKSAMKYPTQIAAETVAIQMVAKFPELIGHVEVRRMVHRKKGPRRTVPCRR